MPITTLGGVGLPGEEATIPQALPTLHAVAQLSITPGDITGLPVNSRFTAALYMDVGLYYVFFDAPGVPFIPKAYDDVARVRVTDKGDDYIVITVTDENGDPTDPAEIAVEIIRVG